ncbi:MAG: TolC family protein [Pseudomonadota bacterium]
MKPKPVSVVSIAKYSQAKLDEINLASTDDPPTLSLAEAESLAVSNNLDQQVARLKHDLAKRELGVSNYNMLPELVAKSSYYGRNVYSGTNNAPLQPSNKIGSRTNRATTSQDLHTVSSELSIGWNILDFGLSYFRAKQVADEVLIAQEMYQRGQETLKERVHETYWRAWSHQRYTKRIHKVRSRIEKALATAERLENERATSPLTSLTYQREILNIEKSISGIEAGSVTAKAELATLIGARPGGQFLFAPQQQRDGQCSFILPSEKMTNLALRNRPEIREAYYKERLSSLDVKIALLETLPNANLSASTNLDSNSFLFNQNWLGWSSQVGWNLMKAFTYSRRKSVAVKKTEIAKAQGMATVLAVVGQVHIARAQYFHAKKALKAAKRLQRVQKRILRQMKASRTAGVADENTVVREELNAILADMELDTATTYFWSACSKLRRSMGISTVGQLVSAME